MKYIQVVIFFFLAALQCKAETVKTVKLSCTVSSALTKEDQWVFWFSIRENEYEIVDSCLLKKNQDAFVLQHDLEDDYCMNWLTFSKSGPIQMILELAPGETVTIDITEKTFMFPKVEGSVATMERYDSWMKAGEIRNCLLNLEDRFMTTNSDSLKKVIVDSITYYKDYRSVGLDMDLLRVTKSGSNYAHALNSIKYKISQAKLDSLENYMLSHFPYSKSVERYFDNTPSAPSTANSDLVLARFDEIINNRRQADGLPPIATSQPKYETKKSPASPKKAEYTIGSKVSDISLDGIDGNKKSLFDIKKKYILIDFWASWCGPCRRQVPALIKMQEKHKALFSIYAISIDDNEGAWKEAVRFDRSDNFIHVRAAGKSEMGKLLNDKFGLEYIPSNFLLNEKREIIGVNLNEDSLMKKFGE